MLSAFSQDSEIDTKDRLPSKVVVGTVCKRQLDNALHNVLQLLVSREASGSWTQWSL